MNPKNFFSELKRRNVYRVGVAYAVVAWLLIQVATQVFPFFEIPNWAVRLVIMLLVLGFPVALILAWAFELTPEGIKRAEDVSPAEAFSSRKRGKWMIAVVVVAMAALALLITQLVKNQIRSVSVEIPANNAIPEKSIAVLPFDNLSGNPENAYFTEGIQEEILTRLAKIADLKVISRTSTARYKSSPDNLKEIATQLGVSNILEGSVQRSADKVRINVQLIKAETDAHLWADTFDRKLSDVFAIESDIAKTIADTLQTKLTGSEKQEMAHYPTANPVAHELYLKGRFFWSKRNAADFDRAISYFNQAIERDPGYALAYAALADTYVLLPTFGGGAPRDWLPKAKAAAKRALELDDKLAEAHTSLAMALWSYDYDFNQSHLEFHRAIELNPNYATAHIWYGTWFLTSLGRFDDGVAEIKRALELDPLSLVNNTDLGSAYIAARRYDAAIDQLRRTVELDPTFYYAHQLLGVALELRGDFAQAIAEYQKAQQLSDDPILLGELGHAYAAMGKSDETRKILNQLREMSAQRYVYAYSFTLLHLALGDKEEAIRWLEKGYQDGDGFNIVPIKIDPFLDPLRADVRFEQLVAKVFSGARAEQRKEQTSAP